MASLSNPLCFVAILCTCYFVLPVLADFQRLNHQPRNNGSLNVLVIGDWGRKGLYNQSLVASQMGKVGDKVDLDFIISTGDNFYDNGIESVNDTAFQESFSKVYTAKSLQKPWFSVLGNHDYRGNALAQLSPILRKIDRRWFCQRSYIVNAGIAEFFFIDTSPMINDYFDTFEHSYDWRGASPRQIYLSKLLTDFEEALMKSNAAWKIVVGHHGIKSIGHHGDSPELISHLIPILKANNVDMYVNGHDHCLQHIASIDSPLLFLTSGAGSKAWRGDVKENHNDDVRFFYDGQGFMSLHINDTDTEFAFYDVFGEIIHHWKLTKPLHASI